MEIIIIITYHSENLTHMSLFLFFSIDFHYALLRLLAMNPHVLRLCTLGEWSDQSCWILNLVILLQSTPDSTNVIFVNAGIY